MERLTIKGASHVFYVLLIMCVISLNFLDPINWPKQIAIATVAPLILRKLYLSSEKEFRVVFMRSYIFKLYVLAAILLLATCFFSDANSMRSLWGTWGRNNGIVTLISLILISISYTFYALQSVGNIERIFIALTLGLVPTALYGVLQKLDFDPVQWSTVGQVFGPFGNTNFASAIWGTASLISLYLTLVKNRLTIHKLMFGSMFLLYLLVTYLTNSIQGLLMITLGAAALIFIKVSERSRNKGVILLIILVFLGSIVGLGMFGIGQLSPYVYQYTLKLRSYYWLAGLRMGLEHPIFGVGVDSYGDYFRLFRPIEAALATGIDLTTNNAHNSFIQLFATLGIVGSIGILSLWTIGIIRAIRVFLNMNQKEIYRIASAAFLLLWLISMISIDNIAIASLNYIFLGIVLSFSKPLVSLSLESNEIKNRRSKQVKHNPWSLAPIALISVAVGAFTVSLLASSPDRNVLEALKKPVVANDQNSMNLRSQMLIETSKQKFMMESQYRFLAKALYESRYLSETLSIADIALKKYPNDFANLDLKANALENLNRRIEAKDIRYKQLTLEPNHPLIWLNYALNLKSDGENQKAKLAYTKALQLKELTTGQSLIELEKLRTYFD